MAVVVDVRVMVCVVVSRMEMIRLVATKGRWRGSMLLVNVKIGVVVRIKFAGVAVVMEFRMMVTVIRCMSITEDDSDGIRSDGECSRNIIKRPTVTG